MPTYDAQVDAAVENNSHSLMIRLVGPDRTVLDVGCATGYLGRALQARGCRVSGVELDAVAAAQAAEDLDEVLVADLAEADLVAHFGPASFDVVVLGDVLEHMTDPVRVLRGVVGLLRPGGSVVISTPNVTHASLRLALLQGRWRYTDRGLLDETHVHFFDRAGLDGLISGAGLVAVESTGTTAGPLETEVAVDAGALPPGVLDWVREQPDADVYQFVVRAVVKDEAGMLEALTRRTAEAEERTRLAQEQAQVLAAEVAELRGRLEAAERDAAGARSDLRALHDTRSMRALRGPRRVWGAVRRGRA